MLAFWKIRAGRSKSLSLSFGDTSTKRNRSIDRYIDISGGRIEISGKDRDGKLAVRELNGFSPEYIPLSLFLSPLAGFSLRFNDRLTESLCFFLSLSLYRDFTFYFTPCSVWKIGYIDRDRVSTFAKLSRRSGERMERKAVSSRKRKIARFAFPFFPPLLQNLYLSDFLPSSLVSPLLSSSTSPPFRRLARIVATCRALPNFTPPLLHSPLLLTVLFGRVPNQSLLNQGSPSRAASCVPFPLLLP